MLLHLDWTYCFVGFNVNIPFTSSTAPSCQDAYDDVVSQRILEASKRKPGLFGVCGLITNDDLGPEGRRRTPQFLMSERHFFRWATGSDSAPISTIEERKLFNKLMTDFPGVGTSSSISWPEMLDRWNEKIDNEYVFGKTLEHLIRHHTQVWTSVNAKVTAVREGSEGLKKLQLALHHLFIFNTRWK